tara:strand:+ start:944 stop:1135 length:192 start_codon:yes stop_codon:yes gene_type:complete
VVQNDRLSQLFFGEVPLEDDKSPVLYDQTIHHQSVTGGLGIVEQQVQTITAARQLLAIVPEQQ